VYVVVQDGVVHQIVQYGVTVLFVKSTNQYISSQLEFLPTFSQLSQVAPQLNVANSGLDCNG
jgi:hypothetical protein